MAKKTGATENFWREWVEVCARLNPEGRNAIALADLQMKESKGEE